MTGWMAATTTCVASTLWPVLACLALAGCARSSVVAPAEVAITPIQDVQGNGRTSPLEGQFVTVTGIVTGDFQAGDAHTQRNLGGFFMQEESPDADPLTSDGIFIDDGTLPGVDVDVGDRVIVAGTVTEISGETRLTALSVTMTGTGTITPATLTLPTTTTTENSNGVPLADLERYEGMLVKVSQPLFINDLYYLERYGEISLSADGRLFQFTNGDSPGVAGYAMHRRQVAVRSLIMDDGATSQNPPHIAYLNPPGIPRGYSVRAGDSIQGLTGNIRYSRGSRNSGFEAYRLEPTGYPRFLSVNSRDSTPPDPGGVIKVASFNVLNFFTTIDDGQRRCGPSGNAGCRGADSVEEFGRQRAKLLNALLLLDADIVGLMELENNDDVAISNLVAGLNGISGANVWAFVGTGSIGTDAITVGLIFKTATVREAGDFATLTSAFDARFNDRRNRPSLAQTFDTFGNGGRFTVVVNHLKSKGSSCDDLDDPDLDDGQGNCNGARLSAVLAMLDWLATDPTRSGDPDFLVIGDMNAYLAEDPIVAFEHGGYINLLRRATGHDAYSFVFAGQAGALDHALASPALASQVTGAAEWHINADEPPVLDYNLEFGRDAGLFDAGIPFRASDHDPVIIGLNPRP